MKHSSHGDLLSASPQRQNKLTCLSLVPQSVQNITPKNVFIYAVRY